MDYQDLSILKQSLHHAVEIAYCGFYNADPSWVQSAAFTQLLINLKDCLNVLHRNGNRVNFTDDLPDNSDITDQIIKMRNAACHLGSAARYVDQNGVSLHFGIAIGKCALINVKGIVLENPYDDDVAFFYGNLRLFLLRHIRRAIVEAETKAEALSLSLGHPWHPIQRPITRG